jgi:hydrogenase maturation factor
MCLGAISELVETWDESGARVGRLADGSVVTLGFVPEARVGSPLLVHLGVPVEVLDRAIADQALSLRETAPRTDHGGVA